MSEMHVRALREFEGRRYCSVAEAMQYLDIKSRSTFDQLLNSQAIRSQYSSHRDRKVVVASLLAYADNLPIDRPAPRKPR
ncbi:hypothetical protein [Phytoactinopolyspora alkaliphila]|nr:hypothetical protein [Phytoactinopolyspora alkaliphila]